MKRLSRKNLYCFVSQYLFLRKLMILYCSATFKVLPQQFQGIAKCTRIYRLAQTADSDWAINNLTMNVLSGVASASGLFINFPTVQK